MESREISNLAAIVSYLYIAVNVEGHRIIEQPRLSAQIILFVSGALSFVASTFLLWFPGANGRFDDEVTALKKHGHPPTLQKRVRRYFLPLLIACVALRIELLFQVSWVPQCSSRGVEAWLPFLLVLYELLPGRRVQLHPVRVKDEYDEDYFNDTNFDYIKEVLVNSRAFLVSPTLLLSWVAQACLSRVTKSTFFCSNLDQEMRVLALQWASLGLDASIIVLLWRILICARTRRTRLRTLGLILVASALSTGLLSEAIRLFNWPAPFISGYRNIDSLYLFDIVMDSLVMSVLFVSASLAMCELSPLTLASVFTFLYGFLGLSGRIWLLGTWENLLPWQTWWGLLFICTAFSSFLYANSVRFFVLPRALLVMLLVAISGTMFIILLMVGWPIMAHHPIDRIMYTSRIESDRWLTHASVSQTLQLAVQEYRERHGGRDPPRRFDVWWQFAKEKRSPILDHFPQIERDIMPFWGLPPAKIRESVALLAAQPGVAIVKVTGGMPSHNLPKDSPDRPMLDVLLERIKSFAGDVPDIEFAVNLWDRPRILAPWDHVGHLRRMGARQGHGKHLTKRDNVAEERDAGVTIEPRDYVPSQSPSSHTASLRDYRRMIAQACPPGSRTRAGVYWNARDFCSSCAERHSEGQYPVEWNLVHDICHQPDLLRLHGFHMEVPNPLPLTDLLPLFSRSKIDTYSDILIPLPRVHVAEAGENGDFDMTDKRLAWRGQDMAAHMSRDMLRGGHQERLLHMMHNATARDKTTLAVPSRDTTEKQPVFQYEQASIPELNALVNIDISVSDYANCTSASDGPNCETLATSQFGPPKPPPPSFTARYSLILDTDHGPSTTPTLISALRSASVPFVASIFREWHTERTLPWVHFVPIDLRFHALHSTLLYFAGAKGQGNINGRDPEMEARTEDARWIAEQGRRWASKALRREDEEVYLFRLMLEWARVVDDRREEAGFVW